MKSKKTQPRVYKVTREIFADGDFTMLQLIGTRLHNDCALIKVNASFLISGNMSHGNRLEVEMEENPQLLKFLTRTAKSYREELKPYFAQRSQK